MSDQTTDKEKEKPGGAVPGWLSGAAKVGTGQSAAGGGVFGAGGGGLAAKGFLGAKFGAVLSSKAGLAGLIATGLTVGGLVSYNEVQKVKRAETAAQFSDAMMGHRRDSRGAAVAGRSSPGVSALALAQRANKGLYGSSEEAAEADAAAEDGDGMPEVDGAEGDALGQSDSQAAAAEMAEAMGEEQASKAAKEGLGRRFGKMSAGTGGGGRMQLAGGAGMSGGIGGKFKKSTLTNKRLTAISKGRKAGVSRSKTAARGRKGSSLKGAHAKRLDKMNRAMGTAGRGPATETAAVHTQQWDAAQPGGQALDGAGAGGIGSDGGFGEGEGVGSGDPISSPSGGGTGAAATSAPSTGSGKNVTPYQSQINIAAAMLILAGIIILVVSNLAKGVITEGAAAALYGIAILLAYISLIMSLVVASQYGQAGQGTILAIGAAVTITAGALALGGVDVPTWAMVLLAVAGIAAGMGGILSGDKVDDSAMRFESEKKVYVVWADEAGVRAYDGKKTDGRYTDS